MQNFSWLLRASFRYRWTIVGIFVSSLLVALFWGANISALFPVLKVAVKGMPLQDWLEEEIQKSERKILDVQGDLARIDAGPAGAAEEDLPTTRSARSASEHSLRAERRALWMSRTLKPMVELLPRDPFRTVVVITVALVVGTILKGIFVFWNVLLIARLEQRLLLDLRRRFFHQCLRLDQAAFGQERTSGLLSQFNADIGYATAGIRSLFGTALREPLKMLACLAGACFISWRLLLFSLIVTPITALAVSKLGASIKRANRRSLEEFTALHGVLTEAFQGIETVHAYVLERHQRGKFFRAAKTCLHKAMRIAWYNALTKPVTELLGICVIALALLSGAYLTINQATHVGPIRMLDRPIEMELLLLFFALLVGATEPARKLTDVFNTMQAAVAASDRLVPLLDRTPTIRSPRRPIPLPKKIEQIAWRQVSFHYDARQPVLVDFNLQISAGETIAIVGPNGCGKTTLVGLLPRFQDPCQGQVVINDVDVRKARLEDLRRRIGIVTQRALLFDDTVYNNIRHGRLDATPAEIMRAARQAYAHQFITEKLDQGYETVIGAGGGNLSGGQRQRLALARAIVRDPDILILDEATSQIDLESERLVQATLEDFARGRTVIMITHRLATLELADRIVAMNQGRIEDVGTHSELMGRCELYQRLHESQFRRSA